MAVGPIQFSVSTNPIDGLNARLKTLGRKEVITSVRSHPTNDYIDYDVCYVAGGKQMAQWVRRCPPDSLERFVEKFLTHLSDSEYQQYLDDHKAMTLESLFVENRFPRARERAFLDFRTLAASQTRYESFDYSDLHSGVVKKVLDAYLTHHLPDLSSIKCDAFAARENGHAIVSLHSLAKWEHRKTIKVPLSQDMPWYTAAQQARDTLKEWIDAAAQKKSETATASDGYTVWIWGIEYPNARVEYRESFDVPVPRFGSTSGVYRAGAKVSGVPRTEEPFDIALKYIKGDIVVLRNCSWVADGEIRCDGFEMNGKSSFQPEMGVAAAQGIPKGVVATPARAMAYLNGTPIGFVSSIDYSGTVHPGADAEGRVTTTAQQVREAIDRSNAISVPTRDEIKRSLLERVANDGSRKVSEVMVDLVAESTHETYKAIAQVAEGSKLQEEAHKVRFDNLATQPLTAEALRTAFELMKAHPHNWQVNKDGRLEAIASAPTNIPLDSAPQIGDDASVSKTLWPTTHELGRMTLQERTVWSACVEHYLDAAKRGGPAPPQDLVAYFKETTVSGNISKMFSLNNELSDLVKWDGVITGITSKMTVAGRICFVEYMIGNQLHSMDVSNDIDAHQSITSELIRRGHASRKETTVSDANAPSFKNRATAEAIEVAYRTAAIKLPDLVKRQLVKRMASKGGKTKPSQARLSLAEEMLSGDEGSLIVAGILSLALSASPEFIKSKMPWLDLDRLARELRLNVETRIACAVADMLGMYLDGALEALKEAFGGSQQLLLAEGGRSDESALFSGVPKAETVRV